MNTPDREPLAHPDAALQQSVRQLSGLTHRLMTKERSLVKGLAQTLHDKLGQTLAATRMAHETMLTLQESQAAVMPPEIARLQVQMGTLIGQAIAEVRQLLCDLWPPQLEEKGFVAAFDVERARQSLGQPKVAISFHVDNEAAVARWPVEVEYGAFMVAREALENALRHSGSRPVSVRLSGTAGALQFEISDHGDSMVAAPDGQLHDPGSFGMQDWARMIDAELTVESVAQQGTRLRFCWRPAP